MKLRAFVRRSRRVRAMLGALLGLGLLAPVASAFEFASGELKGAFDTTLSFGGSPLQNRRT